MHHSPTNKQRQIQHNLHIKAKVPEFYKGKVLDRLNITWIGKRAQKKNIVKKQEAIGIKPLLLSELYKIVDPCTGDGNYPKQEYWTKKQTH